MRVWLLKVEAELTVIAGAGFNPAFITRVFSLQIKIASIIYCYTSRW